MLLKLTLNVSCVTVPTMLTLPQPANASAAGAWSFRLLHRALLLALEVSIIVPPTTRRLVAEPLTEPSDPAPAGRVEAKVNRV